MRVVLQRVDRASCTVDGKITGQIGKGYMLLVGFTNGDDLVKVQKAAKKIRKAGQDESIPSAEEFEKATEEEIGELLYALCKLADNSDVDAETALAKYTDKVIEKKGKKDEN